jgi:Family of unknown function (DUF6445)
MVDLNGKLRLHPGFAIRTIPISAGREVALIVDNFVSEPELLVEYAAAHSTFDAVSDNFYPGTRAPIPPIYCFALRAFLGAAIAEAFGLTNNALTGELSHFSLVTTQAEKLRVAQRMPHFDSHDPKQLALLHYLCEPSQGGTSFYRHLSTGFEFVDAPRKQIYAEALAADLARLGPPPAQYICGDDPLFARAATVSAAFNRVLIYRSINLHSADIGSGFEFSGNPRQGRLTANTFFYYR